MKVKLSLGIILLVILILFSPLLVSTGAVNGLPPGRSSTVVVAAANATAIEKLQADYICPVQSCLTELNNAVVALPGKGGSIHLSSGIISLASGETWTITKNVALQGSGKGYYYPSGESTTLYKIGAGDALVFEGNHNITVSVRDLTIQKEDNTTWANGDGIKLVKVNDFLLDNIQVDSAGGVGINVLASWGGMIQNSIIRHSSSYGIYYGKAGAELTTAQRLFNNHLGANTNYDVYIDSALGINITENHFEQYSSSENFIYIDNASVVIEANYFSASYPGTKGVYAHSGNVKFLNNTIGGDYDYGYDAMYGLHTIIGNHFQGLNHNAAIRINDWLDSAIVANNYFVVGTNYAMLLYGPSALISVTGNIIKKQGGSGLLNVIQSNGQGVISANTFYSPPQYGSLGIIAPNALVVNNYGIQ